MYKDREYRDIPQRPKSVFVTLLFEDFDNLLSSTKRLSGVGYSGASSLFYDDICGKYYIILEDVSVKDLKYAFLSEYSKCIKGNASYYIKEHFKCICKKDAVKKLALATI